MLNLEAEDGAFLSGSGREVGQRCFILRRRRFSEKNRIIKLVMATEESKSVSLQLL